MEGSGTGRPKNLRIRILNTACNFNNYIQIRIQQFKIIADPWGDVRIRNPDQNNINFFLLNSARIIPYVSEKITSQASLYGPSTPKGPKPSRMLWVRRKGTVSGTCHTTHLTV